MKYIVSFVRWLVGGFFAMGSLIELSQGSLLSGIAAILLAILLIPVLSRFVFSKISNPIPTIAKVSLGLLAFFIMVGTANSKETENSLVAPTPESQQFEVIAQPTLEPTTTPSVTPAATAQVTTRPTIRPTAPKPVVVKPVQAHQVSGRSCTGPDLDCRDFSSHFDVMGFWSSCGFSASNDPHRLDGNDNDGKPCESLR